MDSADSLEAAAAEAQQGGRHDEAVALLRQAVALDPRSPERLNTLANALFRARAFQQAQEAYRAAHALDPGFYKPLANLGRVAIELGDLAQARRWLALAVERDPEAARARVTYGSLLTRLSLTAPPPERDALRAEARAQLEQALARAPDLVQAWLALADLANSSAEALATLREGFARSRSEPVATRLAQVSLTAGHIEESLLFSRFALAFDPDSPALAARDRSLDALARGAPPGPAPSSAGTDPAFQFASDAMTRAAIAVRRGDPSLLRALAARRASLPGGFTQEVADRLTAIGAHAEALEAHRAALAEHPSSYRVRTRMAQSLLATNDPAGALSVLEPVAPRWTEDVIVGVSAAGALTDLARFTEAATLLGRLAERFPQTSLVHERIVTPLIRLGRIEEALAHLQVRARIDPTRHGENPGLFNLHYRVLAGPADIAERHVAWSASLGPSPRIALPRRPVAGRKVRVAYLSSDFVTHPVPKFLVPVLAAHDRSRFEIHAVSGAAVEDAVTARIRGCVDGFHPVAGRSPEEIAAVCRALAIDVAIDLSGHTGGSLARALRHGAAPVQMTWLGYPNTTGLGEVDWRITDGDADPPGVSEALHAERLLRLPEGAWCFVPSEDRALAEGPAARNGWVTFGSFNSNAKIGPRTLSLWAKVLRAVPSARLALKSDALRDTAGRDMVTMRLRAHGLDPDRVTILPREENPLDSFAHVDVALDAFPYHGTTTSCEGLWMGVPSVVLAGEAHVSRVGVSLMRRVGLGSLVARDDVEYVCIAADIAADLPRLASIRAGLRDAMRASALGDPSRFAAQLEQALLRTLDGPEPTAESRGLRPIEGASRVVSPAIGVRVPFGPTEGVEASEAWTAGASLSAVERWVVEGVSSGAELVGIGAPGGSRVARIVAAQPDRSAVLFARDVDEAKRFEAALAPPARPWARLARSLRSSAELRVVAGPLPSSGWRAIVGDGPIAWMCPRGAAIPEGMLPIVLLADAGLWVDAARLPGCLPSLALDSRAVDLFEARYSLARASGEPASDLTGCSETYPALGDPVALAREVGPRVARMMGSWWAAMDRERSPAVRGASLCQSVEDAIALGAQRDGGLDARMLAAAVLCSVDHEAAPRVLSGCAEDLRAGGRCTRWMPLDRSAGCEAGDPSSREGLLATVLQAIASRLPPDAHAERLALAREHGTLGVPSDDIERILVTEETWRLTSRVSAKTSSSP
jgi:protein O-GlcNAc transferase